MAQNEVPPWEELPPHEDEDVPGDDVDIAAQLGVCDATGYVTQGQFAAMLQLVKDQRKLIDRLSVQVAGMINRNPGRPNPGTVVGGDVKGGLRGVGAETGLSSVGHSHILIAVYLEGHVVTTTAPQNVRITKRLITH